MRTKIMDAAFFVEGKEKADKYPSGKERKRESKWRPEGKINLFEID